MFTSALVKDKFEKQLIMMEQNGLSRWTYWLVTYIFNYCLYIIIAVVVTVVSLSYQIRIFTQVCLFCSLSPGPPLPSLPCLSPPLNL